MSDAEPLIDVLSFGGGVQSTTVALRAAHGDIRPSGGGRWTWEGGDRRLWCVFADPQWEPGAVYEHIDWLRTGNVLPFPIHTVTAGNIREDHLRAKVRGLVSNGDRAVGIPYFTDAGRVGQLNKQCTREYKIDPVAQFCRREVLGLKPRQVAPRKPAIALWIGISTDEASRMKPSVEPWHTRRYPLAMELGMSRNDCLAWMESHGYPMPPRSKCRGCPYQSDAEWRQTKQATPDEWDDVVAFDDAIRKTGGEYGDVYLHRSATPLRFVDLNENQLSLWGEECEGFCGL